MSSKAKENPSNTLKESSIIAVQHKSLISKQHSADVHKIPTSSHSMGVSDKKIRTLERNRNISPAPFHPDSTDSEDEDAKHKLKMETTLKARTQPEILQIV